MSKEERVMYVCDCCGFESPRKESFQHRVKAHLHISEEYDVAAGPRFTWDMLCSVCNTYVLELLKEVKAHRDTNRCVGTKT